MTATPCWRGTSRECTYGDVRLDGLNVLMVASFTGNISQREALQMIFGGQAGGWPGELVGMFHPEMRGMEFAPIEFDVADDLSSWGA